MEIPTFDKEIQVEFDKVEFTDECTITELKLDHIEKLESEVKTLNVKTIFLEREIGDLKEAESQLSESLSRAKSMNKDLNNGEGDDEVNLFLTKCEEAEEKLENEVDDEESVVIKNKAHKDKKAGRNSASPKSPVVRIKQKTSNKSSVNGSLKSSMSFPKLTKTIENSNEIDNLVDEYFPSMNNKGTEEFKIQVKEQLSKAFETGNLRVITQAFAQLFATQNLAPMHRRHHSLASSEYLPLMSIINKDKKGTKNTNRIKTIIRKPVFEIKPFNMRWMEKIMDKRADMSELTVDIAIQTGEDPEPHPNNTRLDLDGIKGIRKSKTKLRPKSRGKSPSPYIWSQTTNLEIKTSGKKFNIVNKKSMTHVSLIDNNSNAFVANY